MLITFSKERRYPAADIDNAAKQVGATMECKWVCPDEVRFTLPGASEAQHESVIRALLTLDPHARIRTARAVYESLEDYQAQVKARTLTR